MFTDIARRWLADLDGVALGVAALRGDVLLVDGAAVGLDGVVDFGENLGLLGLGCWPVDDLSGPGSRLVLNLD